MGFHLITLVLIILKAFGYITFSWWLVLLPSIFVATLGLVVFSAIFITTFLATK